MSQHNKETKQSNQHQEAHKIRAISRPVVKTPMASRQGLQTLLLYRVLLAFTITVLPFPAHDTVQFPGLVLGMNSLQCQLARDGSLLVANKQSGTKLLAECPR